MLERALGGIRGAATAASTARVACMSEGCVRMSAWRVHTYGGLSELSLEEARVPPLRAPDELLVKVHAASLNPLDVAMIGGYGSVALNMLRRLQDSLDTEGVEFPLVPGRDLVGTVVQAGVLSRLKPGMRVWAVVPPQRPGSHAQYVIVKDKWAGLAPDNFTDVQAGGALYAALTAKSLLKIAGLSGRERKRVLLLGLGGVGQAALQLMKQTMDTEVIVGCSGDLSGKAMSLGAAAVLDRHSTDYDKLLEESGPYEVILDCAGLGGWEASNRRWKFSRYVTLTTPLLKDTDTRGAALGSITSAATLAAQCLSVSRHQAVCPPPHVRWAYFIPSQADIDMLKKLADKSMSDHCTQILDISKICLQCSEKLPEPNSKKEYSVEVEAVYPWRQGKEAYERASQGHARGKLILDFTKD